MRLDELDIGWRTYLLDTCFTDPNALGGLPRLLYAGVRSLATLSDEFIVDEVERLSDLKPYVNSGKIVVIPEVIEELSAKVEFLQEHNSYLARNIEAKNGKRNRQRWNRNKKTFADDEDYEFSRGKVEMLNLLTNVYFDFLRFCRMSRDLELELGNQDYAKYQSFISLGNVLFRDERIRSLSSKSELNHSSLLGDRLNTDIKLAATAYHLAHNSRVTILTYDWGIKRLVEERIPKAVESGSAWRHQGIESLPRNGIDAPFCRSKQHL